MRFHRRRIYRQNIGADFGEFILVRLKGGKLAVSPRCVVFDIKNQNGIVVAAFRKRDLDAARSLQREIRSGIIYLKHRSPHAFIKFIAVRSNPAKPLLELLQRLE
jgi:hypothetical protein